MKKIYYYFFFFLLFFSIPMVSASLSSDFFFDENYLYDLDTDIQPVEYLYVEGEKYEIKACGCFLFDINNSNSVRNVTYSLGRESPPTRNNSFTAWYIEPLDDMLYSLWKNQGLNSSLGPKIMGNLSIIGTGCTDNPTCYASNVSSIILSGSFDDLKNLLRHDDRFIISPRGEYITSTHIIFRNRDTDATLERITPSGPLELEWDTAYAINGTNYFMVFTSQNFSVKGFKLYEFTVDTNNTLVGFLILMSIMGGIILFYSIIVPDQYVKLVLLFFSGFFFLTSFMLTNGFYGTTYFSIASFIGVAYNMLGIVLLGVFIYLFFSMGIFFVIMPILNRWWSGGKKR